MVYPTIGFQPSFWWCRISSINSTSREKHDFTGKNRDSSKDEDLTGNGQEFQCREATFQSDILGSATSVQAKCWVQQLLLGSATSVQARIPKKEDPTVMNDPTVFDTQKTMVVNPRVGRFSGDGWGISGGIFLGSKWVVFVDTVLEMIPAWFRFEHYSPWPNFSFPGFVNARTSPHKNKEHQRKPSYQREKTEIPDLAPNQTAQKKQASQGRRITAPCQKQPTNQQL